MTAISVIIPVLNDEEALRNLLGELSRQQGVGFEVVICDGGSDNDPAPWVSRQSWPFPVRVLRCERGRARQMNRGAAEARSPLLVFMHADSRLPEPDTLLRARTELTAAWDRVGHQRLAGHLSLKFSGGCTKGFPWYYYESKARSQRPLTIHGDQSFWLHREFFQQLQGFDPDRMLMEDGHLAERVRGSGAWLLLTPEIQTSARRFEREGLRQRQTLNALLVAFDQVGWAAFFAAAPGAYRQQAETRSLLLEPFWRLIRSLLQEMGWKERWRLWYRTGDFVRRQFWQVLFSLEARRRFGRELPPSGEAGPLVQWSDRWWDRITGNPAGKLVATFLLAGWFYSGFFRIPKQPVKR